MSADALLATFGIYAGTFVIAALSSVFPLVSIEVFLIALTITRGPADAAVLIVLATVGQVLGKLPVYGLVRSAAALPGRQQRWIARIRAWNARAGNRPHLVLGISALVGLPPFSLASTAAGVLAISLRSFCVVIAVCRAARFAVVIAVSAAWSGG